MSQSSIHEEIKIGVRECLLSFSAESFVFQFTIQKSRRLTLAGHEACMEERTGANKVLLGNQREGDHLED
jgi:hypothetical protein